MDQGTLTKGHPMTRFRLFLALGAAVLSFATASARADEQRWDQHGTVCVPASSGGTSTFYNSFGVNNVSTSTPLTVQCPLITTSATANLHITEVHVGFFDRGSTRLTCTLRNVDFVGAGVVYSETQTSQGNMNIFQTLVFHPPAGNTTGGFWEVECTIPAVNNNNYSAVTAMYMLAGS
jgi:hypothetical protein